MDTITLNYASYDDALKAALSGKEPGEECVLTIRAKVVSNSEESVDLETEEVTLDDYSEPEMEDEEEMMDEEKAPAMVIAIAKKPKK